jgi:hypothetical protein
MELVTSLSYLEIFWDVECQAIVCRWRGGYVNRRLREGLDAGLLELTRRPGAQWIGDTTDIGVISDADKAWVETDWFPRFLATKVRYMAVVQPASAVARLSVSAIVAKMRGTDLTVLNCATLDEARRWMLARVGA